jgi:hypothetical protein
MLPSREEQVTVTKSNVTFEGFIFPLVLEGPFSLLWLEYEIFP